MFWRDDEQAMKPPWESMCMKVNLARTLLKGHRWFYHDKAPFLDIYLDVVVTTSITSVLYSITKMAELIELFEFLSSPNPAARQIALQNLIGHTPKNSAHRDIFIPSSFAALPGDKTDGGLLPEKRKEGAELDDIKIKAIKDLANLCRDQAVIAHDALSALINLTDNLAVARHLADHRFLVWLVSYTAVSMICHGAG